VRTAVERNEPIRVDPLVQEQHVSGSLHDLDLAAEVDSRHPVQEAPIFGLDVRPFGRGEDVSEVFSPLRFGPRLVWNPAVRRRIDDDRRAFLRRRCVALNDRRLGIPAFLEGVAADGGSPHPLEVRLAVGRARGIPGLAVRGGRLRGQRGNHQDAGR